MRVLVDYIPYKDILMFVSRSPLLWPPALCKTVITARELCRLANKISHCYQCEIFASCRGQFLK